ncbi:AAA family ATPase [Shinella sp. BYT-45]|uniref:AAA family ATPase n=1 Tax=Shinella sp. BYT-45 TaxID=3377377 RepID=UPI0039804759
MNKHVTTRPAAGSPWDRPRPSSDFLAKHSDEDIRDWQGLTERVQRIAVANDFSKAEVTRRTGMKEGTFSQWYSGTYTGRLEPYNRMVANWLDAFEDGAATSAKIPASPDYITTRIGTEIFETLQWAQIASDMVMITIGAGMGKTAACRRYAATRPHVYHATVSPHTKTVHGMLVELAAELDVRELNPAKLTRAIGAKLQRIGGGTLLIVDEAQNLVDDAINQLRHFMDIYGCGIALVGNEEVYSRFGKANGGPSYAQLKRRIGKRLKLSKPYPEDVKAYVAAWDITAEDCVRFLLGIGHKGGALGQIEKTVKLAYMLAMGLGEELQLKHLQAAWRNRDVEDMQ